MRGRRRRVGKRGREGEERRGTKGGRERIRAGVEVGKCVGEGGCGGLRW